MLPLSREVRMQTLHPLHKPGTRLSLTPQTGMMLFQEVWGRSFCRTIEKLVEVVQEYPGEVEHIFSPACVPLVRCAGCCGDEKLECHPTHTSNVTMQLLKIKPAGKEQEYVEMTFVEHQTYPGRSHRKMKGGDQEDEAGRERKDREQKTVKSVSLLAGNCSHAPVATWVSIYSPLSASSINSLLSTLRILRHTLPRGLECRGCCGNEPYSHKGCMAAVDSLEKSQSAGGMSLIFPDLTGGAAQ
ncbi:hypothetical protein JZ751_002788 [Albula glossodonta]|uniref:Platelet-derived growth factor (PDGF) family profile domain-containing protein n=1 Tax=Albula glossodonta TaxID=121402 RepID=A0A8T2NCB5_9TELE|nr:hypothetical protein JZ751_002788 [Albula glossodonta]